MQKSSLIERDERSVVTYYETETYTENTVRGFGHALTDVLTVKTEVTQAGTPDHLQGGVKRKKKNNEIQRKTCFYSANATYSILKLITLF